MAPRRVFCTNAARRRTCEPQRGRAVSPMSTSETGDEPNFLARMLAKAQRQQPATSGDMDLRPAPMDDVGSSSEERSWWWKKPSRKLTAFDLLYGLQAQEAAIGTTPSEVEVEVIGMAFQQTAARLEAMGEVDKAEVHAHTGQCMETACTSLNPCYTACHVCACALHVHCMCTACALHTRGICTAYAGRAARLAAVVPAANSGCRATSGRPRRRLARGLACGAVRCSHGYRRGGTCSAGARPTVAARRLCKSRLAT